MAASMTAVDIRTFVRTYLDIDTDELPDVLIDRFMQDGFNRIIGWFDDRPTFYQVDYSFTTTASQQAYSLDSYSGVNGSGGTPVAPLQFVQQIRSTTQVISPVQHEAARRRYNSGSATSSTARCWSLWNRSLYLWPIPSSAATYSVIGIRQPIDWITPNLSVDLPDQLHELVAWWALNRAAGQQDDLEMSAFFRDEFVPELKNRADRYLHGNDAGPFIANAGGVSDGTLGPLYFPWQ